MNQLKNNSSMNNNVIDWDRIGDPGYCIRPSQKKPTGVCKVDKTDSSLSPNLYLTHEELDILSRFLIMDHHYLEMLRRSKSFIKDDWEYYSYINHFCDNYYYDVLFHHVAFQGAGFVNFNDVFDGVSFCQSSFDSYSHLAIEDEIEEERELYRSEDILEHGFYAKEIRRWQMEDDRHRSYEVAPRSEYPVETTIRPVNVELLGCYFPYQSNNNDLPEVHLFMDIITETARCLCVPRWYIVVAVFLHEMCHAYFDRFPLLLPKNYIPEIEEPIAECLSLQILYSFVEMSKFFYPNGELLNVFDTAYSMVYSMRHFKKLCYYSLGIELFHSNYIIGFQYHRHSYFLQERSQAVQNYVKEFANGFPQQPFVSVKKMASLL
jgi:hypothetical protein